MASARRIAIVRQYCSGLLLLLAVGCGGSDTSQSSVTGPTPVSPSTSTLFRGEMAARATTHSQIPVVALDTKGSALGVINGGSSGRGGAVLIQPTGNIAVFAGANGLPAQLVVGNVVFLFANYTSSTVDIAAIANGTVTIARNVKSAGGPSTLFTGSRTLNGLRPEGTAATSALQTASILLNAGVCTLAVAEVTSGVGLAGLAVQWPLVASACSSTLVTALQNLGALDDDLLSAGLDNAGNVQTLAAAAKGCTPGLNAAALIDCLATAVDSYLLTTNTALATSTVAQAQQQLGTAACSYSVSPNTATVDASAGASTVRLSASSSACAWNATSNASWITVSPSSGTGSASVAVSHSTNSGSARTGTATVGGQAITVNQAAANVSLTGKWAGSWTWTRSTIDGCSARDGGAFSMSATQSGNSLSGTLTAAGVQSYESDSCTLIGTSTVSGRMSGTVSGTTVLFSFVLDGPYNPLNFAGAGTLANNTFSSSTFKRDTGTGGTGSFTLTRSALVPAISESPVRRVSPSQLGAASTSRRGGN
jgi:BACON domain-containing protein